MVANNQKGQAIFEFLFFLPILIFVYLTIQTSGNSINASINQQKAARHYYFNLLKNNSTTPWSFELESSLGFNFTLLGMSYVGWRYKSENNGGQSFGSCFKYNSIFVANDEEECDDPSEGDQTSPFVRVFTAFGICGETYRIDQEKGIFVPDIQAGPNQVMTRMTKDGCIQSKR